MMISKFFSSLFFGLKTRGFPERAVGSGPVVIRDIPREVSGEWSRERAQRLAHGCMSVRAEAMGARVRAWYDDRAELPFRIGLEFPASGGRLVFFEGASWQEAVSKMTAGKKSKTLKS